MGRSGGAGGAARIAMISEHASPLAALGGTDSGGQNVYVGQLARHLGAAGFEVDVFTRRDHSDQATVVESSPRVRVINVPAGPAEPVPKEELLPFMGAFADWMEDWHRRERYDLLHANFWMSGLVAADLKARSGVPFVVTLHALGRVRRAHQGEADRFPDERFAIEERIIAEADQVIAECPQDRSDLIELYGASPERIRVIPCGFDPEEFHPVPKDEARRRIGCPADEWVVLQLGRMVPRKGVDNVVRSIWELERNYGILARLIVVGGNAEVPDPNLTPEIGRLQRIAEGLGISERVAFTGRRPRAELPYYYSASDVFVTTPWYEPFGITPLEAMACAVPVIGSRVGGIKFSVSDGETGYLVPTRDPAALAERLVYLHDNPDLADRLGRQGLERVHRHFTWKKVSTSVASLYGEVLEDRRGPRIDQIQAGFADLGALLETARTTVSSSLLEAGEALAQCLRKGNKVLVAGNGGSAAQAQHLAAELVGRFVLQGRPGLPVLALTADTAVLTAWSNDIGFDEVFARQVEAYGRPGDLLVGLSTSGRSLNVVEAFRRAKELGLRTVALVGRDGGVLGGLGDVAVVVPSSDTQRVQELHLLVIHLLCQLVECSLFGQQVVPADALVESSEILAGPGVDQRAL